MAFRRLDLYRLESLPEVGEGGQVCLAKRQHPTSQI